MGDFVTLTCPSCGGKLQITSDINRFACAYCGIEHLVKRAPSLITLLPVEVSLEIIRVSTDKTASELAIKRLKAELVDFHATFYASGNKIEELFRGTGFQGYVNRAMGAQELETLDKMRDFWKLETSTERIDWATEFVNAYLSTRPKVAPAVARYELGLFGKLVGAPTKDQVMAEFAVYEQELDALKKKLDRLKAVYKELAGHEKIVNG